MTCGRALARGAGRLVPSARAPGRSTRATALALAAVLALAAFLRFTPRERVEDLRPRPDALEYEESARSLLAGDGYVLWIGDAAYPPRYPPGFPLLVAGSLLLSGGEPGAGIWVVLAAALVAVGGAYRLAAQAAGPTGGLAAALLLALSPLHVKWSRAVMSDVPASAAIVWLCAGLLAALRRRAGAPALTALGLAAGLSGLIRPSALAFVPAAAIVLALDRETPARARGVLALLAGAALGCLPMLAVNLALFGDPFRGGYGYWVGGGLFSLASVFGAPRTGGAGNAWFYGASLLGLGSAYPWPAGVLLLLGVVLGARRGGAPRRLVLLVALIAAQLFLLHVGFVWRWDRFLLPAVPLLCCVMALPLAARERPALRCAATALVAASAFLASTRGDLAPPDPRAWDVAALEGVAAIAEPNAAVLARTSPFLFARMLRDGADRVWVPLLLDEHRRVILRRGLAPLRRDPPRGGWIREELRVPFDPGRAVAAVMALCREGRSVYLSDQLDLHVPFMAELEETLRQRLSLARVGEAGPYVVYRVGCAPRAAAGDAPAALSATSASGVPATPRAP